MELVSPSRNSVFISVSIWIFALGPLNVPIPSRNTSEYWSINHPSEHSWLFSLTYSLNNSFQLSFRTLNKSLDSKIGPDPYTTSVCSSTSCFSYFKTTFTASKTLTNSPVYVRSFTWAAPICGRFYVEFPSMILFQVSSLVIVASAPVSISMLLWALSSCWSTWYDSLSFRGYVKHRVFFAFFLRLFWCLQAMCLFKFKFKFKFIKKSREKKSKRD